MNYRLHILLVVIICGSVLPTSLRGQEYLLPDGTISPNSAPASVADSGLSGVPALPALPTDVFPSAGGGASSAGNSIAPEASLQVDPNKVTELPPIDALPGYGESQGGNPALKNVYTPESHTVGNLDLDSLDKADPDKGTPGNAQLYEGAMISDVKIVGNKLYPFEKIMPYLKTRPGRTFNRKVLEDDIRSLMRSRMFTLATPFFKQTPDGLEIVFHVSERPVLQYIRFVGSYKVRRKYLEKESLLKIGGAVDPSEISSARERIEQYYKSKGFTRASVVIVQGLDPQDPGVIFQINEGPKQKVGWVAFEGNTIASDDRLRTQIQSKPGFLWLLGGELDFDKIELDIKVLEEYYKKLGFLDVTIGREVSYNEKENWATITFFINEGERYRIRNMTIAGNTKYSTEELTKALKLESGEYFNRPQLMAGINSIQSKYGKIGHVFCDVKPDVRYLETPGECDLVLSIKEGESYRVGRVNVLIAGEFPHTQIDTVLNRMSVRPGDIMDTTKIRASERRLKASQLFLNDPAKGSTPAIVYSPPEIKDLESESGERMATPGRRSDNSSSFRGQSAEEVGSNPGTQPDYRYRVHFTPSEPMPGNEPTLDLNVFGVWAGESKSRPEAPRWRNGINAPADQFDRQAEIEPGTTTGTTTDTTRDNMPGIMPETMTDGNADEYNDEYNSVNQNPNTSQKVTFRGQSYGPDYGHSYGYNQQGNNNPQGYNGQGYNPQGFRGQSGAGQDYNIDPFSAPGDMTQTDGRREALYQAPPAGTTVSSVPQQYYNYNPNGAAVNGNTVANPAPAYAPVGNNAEIPSTCPQPACPPSAGSSTGYSPSYGGFPSLSGGAMAAPVNGGVGQTGNFVQDNMTLLPGIPSANSPLGQTGEPYPAVTPTYQPGFIGMDSYLQDRNSLPIAATMEETMTGKMLFSVGVSSESGLLGSIVLDEQNFDWRRWPRSWRDFPDGTAFRGRGQRFKMEAMPGTEIQRYSVSFEEPYLCNTRVSWGVSGVYYERYYNEWDEGRVGGETSFGYQFHQDLVGYIKFRGYSIDISDPINPYIPEYAEMVGNNSLVGVSARLVYDKRDSAYMATEGWYLAAEVEQVFGSFEYPRASVNVKKFFTLWERPDKSGRHVLSMKASLDWSGSDTPTYEHYFTGGPSTIRGFEYREATVRNMGYVVGGHVMLLAAAEYMFPMTASDNVKGVIFCDTGTSERSFDDWNDKYRVSVGFGLRISVPMLGPVPIALDFAFPVSKNQGDDVQVFSFQMGSMF